MKTIHLLKLILDQRIELEEIPYFRAAISTVLNLQTNHQKDGKLIYRYPFTQFKRSHEQAAILFLEHHIEDFMRSGVNFPLELRIGKRKASFAMKNLDMQDFQLQISKSYNYTYRISRWIALNQKNYQTYAQLTTSLERLAFLEKLLANHIIAFMRGIDWMPENRFSVSVTNFPTQSRATYKGETFEVFTLQFQTNCALPNFIGLGKASSQGFGVLHLLNKVTL